MKKIIAIVLFVFCLSSLIYSDELSDLLKNSKGKLVNVYLTYYTPIAALGNASSTWSFRGLVESVTDKYLIIIVDKNDKVSNPYGADLSGKMFIKLDQIAGIKISDIDVKK